MPSVELKEYFESRLASIEKATVLANDTLKTRLEGLNEWRLQNKDERSLYITRAEMEAKIEGIENGRKDKTALYISLIGMATGIVSLIIGFLNK